MEIADKLRERADALRCGTVDNFGPMMDDIKDEAEEIANLERQLFIALEDAKCARFCHAQDAVKLAWWNDTFQGMSRAEVLRLKAPNA